MDALKVDMSKQQNSKLMKQRTLWAILSTLGRQCTVTKSDNSKHSGLIHTLCKKGLILYRKSPGDPIQEKLAIDSLISIEVKEIHTLSKHKFKTDNEISKQSRVQKRVLQQWEGEDSVPLNFDLKDYKSWDQFETNKQKFGVVSTYDENLYTTPVPRLCELTDEQVQRAKIVEKELGVCSLDREETEMDEEAQFGAVLGSGRYESAKKEKKKGKKKDEHRDLPKEGVKRFTNSKKNSTPCKVEEGITELVKADEVKLEPNVEQTGGQTEKSLKGPPEMNGAEKSQPCTAVVDIFINAWSKILKPK